MLNTINFLERFVEFTCNNNCIRVIIVKKKKINLFN